MAYSKPELMLVGAARSLVLGGPLFTFAYDSVLNVLDMTDEMVW